MTTRATLTSSWIRSGTLGRFVALLALTSIAGACTAVSGLNKDYTFGEDDGGAEPDGGPTSEAGGDASGVDASRDATSDTGAGEAGPVHNFCEDKSISVAGGDCTKCAQALVGRGVSNGCCAELDLACSTGSGCKDFLNCFAACPTGTGPSTTGHRTACVEACVQRGTLPERAALGNLGDCIGASAPGNGCAAKCEYR